MAFRLQLRSFELDSDRELRYLNVGPNKDLQSTTPLFLGADILADSHITANNHCRIHTRFSKRGLATKITFPEDVGITGVTNCHSGAWFYTVQGVFQVTFELLPRSAQLKMAKALLEVWHDDTKCPPLPDRMHATLEELQLEQREPFNLSHLQCELDQMNGGGDGGDVGFSTTECEVLDASVVKTPDRQDDDDQLPPTSATIAPPWVDELVDLPTLERPPTTALGRSALWWYCQTLIAKLQSLVDQGGHGLRDLHLTRALLACLRLVRFEARCDRGDSVFDAFLRDVLVQLADLVGDAARLREFGSDETGRGWGLTGRQNALLCTVAEWLGRHFALFGDAITSRADAFLGGERHRASTADHFTASVPPDQKLNTLFPECMQLLVGHWIGLYGTEHVSNSVDAHDEPTTADDDVIVRAEPTYGSEEMANRRGNAQAKRADHSYSNIKREAVGADGSAVGATAPLVAHKTPRADHSYSSAACRLMTGAAGGGSPMESHQIPIRDDHTYVASPCEAAGEGGGTAAAAPAPRRDHTYFVSGRKPKAGSVAPVVVVAAAATTSSASSKCAGQQPQAKRLKTSTWMETRKVVLDPSKYHTAQLNLGFLNRVAMSELTLLQS